MITGEEYQIAALDVVYLAACSVLGKVPDTARVRKMNLQSLYRVAEQHLMTAIVAMALETAGVKDEAFTQAKGKAVRKEVLFNLERAAILDNLEAAGIWYMPLKGAVLKKIYPKSGMRQMSDNDILYEASRRYDVRRIMENRGFTNESSGSPNHDVYHKKPVYNFEMHRALFGPDQDEKLYQYYQNVENKLVKKKGYERYFTPEDFYIYMIAHEYKHYYEGGTGLRSLLDTYVYLNKVSLNMSYVGDEVEKLGIKDFEIANRSLSLHLFSGKKLTDEDIRMYDYILSSGVYGTLSRHVHNEMKRNGWGRLQYMWNRFTVPFSRRDWEYDEFAADYPLFYKHKVLLPLLPFYRIFRSMKSGRFLNEFRAMIKRDE